MVARQCKVLAFSSVFSFVCQKVRARPMKLGL